MNSHHLKTNAINVFYFYVDLAPQTVYSNHAWAPLGILRKFLMLLSSLLSEKQSEISCKGEETCPPHPQTGIRNATCHSFPESILRSLAFGLEVSALTGVRKERNKGQNVRQVLSWMTSQLAGLVMAGDPQRRAHPCSLSLNLPILSSD